MSAVDCWPPEMSVEDHLGGFQTHSFVATIEQLG
jgi:hypothetical protein